MRRLMHVISFTADMERTRAFYRDALGLPVHADTPYMVNFSTDGTGLVLLAVHPHQPREVELCFESGDVAGSVERLRERGVEFIDELRQLAFGSVIHFRDPEGSLLSLLQPGNADAPAGEAEGGGAARGTGGSAARGASTSAARGASTSASKSREAAPQTALALADERPAAGAGPRLSTAILNVRDLAQAHAYYRNVLGLGVSVDSPTWVQFNTGDIRLALHSRRDRNAESLALLQPASFGFTVPDLEAWVDAARERGVQFVSAPADEGFGLTAEIVDPEGNVVIVREPISEESLEERLAAAFEDDDEPHAAGMRRPVVKAASGTSRLAIKPEYKAKRAGRRAEADDERPMPRAKQVVSPRGTGPAGTRAKPKAKTGPNRPRVRSAIGQLKKAEARTLGTAKVAAAQSSRTKPVKRKAATKKSASRRGKR